MSMSEPRWRLDRRTFLEGTAAARQEFDGLPIVAP
jgi:hypothetical protein